MQLTLTVVLSASALTGALATGSNPSLFGRKEGLCPLFKGDFVIHKYQLYPENADFDFGSCLIYTG
jgi:hypothetical protein